MAAVQVDQILPDGSLVQDADTKLTFRRRVDILSRYLPEVYIQQVEGERVLRLGDQALLVRQVHHLGHPWPGFKKRIQIPRRWVNTYHLLAQEGVRTRFVGLYHYRDTTILVDFDPRTYIQRKANNSAAHVATNDLFQAQLHGSFSRVDRNGNRLTSLRADQFAGYLRTDRVAREPQLEVLAAFNAEFLDGQITPAMSAVRQMHEAQWPDTFQGEWPGFYLEYRLDRFLKANGHTREMRFIKQKTPGGYDYDLEFGTPGKITHYGDLKASDYAQKETPGNDAASIEACVRQYGRFWYLIFEHQTWKARDHGDVATIEWNHWRRDAGHTARAGFNELSYRQRFKSAVRFFRMRVLEVNPANFHTVLGDFAQGRQPSGDARALKVMIRKANIDNFLVYSHETPVPELGVG
ncbi:MAG TPA: hypothetical protein VK063_11240 [Beutenbergiaceae bacterium]|nr:hypothetical protein [Beutenbergiaceae bacterium]